MNQRKLEAAEALAEAALAEEAYTNGAPPPWGHDCRWCGPCMTKIDTLRRAALQQYEEAGTR